MIAAAFDRVSNFLAVFSDAVKDLLSPHGPQASRQKTAEQKATQPTCSCRCRQ
jgi:hypothetical protein